MIERHWKGIVQRGKESDYIEHLKIQTFPQLAGINGFIEASIMQRQVESGTEFLVITRWASVDVIAKFAGREIHNAVVPAIAQAMMITYDKQVIHYEVTTQPWRPDYHIS